MPARMLPSRSLSHAGRAIDRFLHAGGRRVDHRELHPVAWLLVIFLCAGTYGAVMAGFYGLGLEAFDGAGAGVNSSRLWMVAYSTIKVPLLFVATLALAVPFFYVVNTLAGVGDDFPLVRRALIDYQLAVAVQLAALAPVTLVVNCTESRYAIAQAWSTLLFGIAAWNARRSLTATYRQLEAAHAIHRWLRHLWFILYAFVGVQMAWTLRPFIGNPELPAQFFRDTIGNAYVSVARVLWRALE